MPLGGTRAFHLTKRANKRSVPHTELCVAGMRVDLPTPRLERLPGARFSRAPRMRRPTRVLVAIAACLSVAVPCGATERLNLRWQAVEGGSECAAFDDVSRAVEE